MYRKTKRYTSHQLVEKIFTIDDARNIVLRLKKLEGLSESTLQNYEKIFNDFDRYFGDKTDVSTLTPEDARNFMYWQLNEKVQFAEHKYRKNKKKGVSKGSANTYLNYAKVVFNVLSAEGIVEENIFVNFDKIKEREKKIELSLIHI